MGSVVGSATRLIDNDGDPMDSGGALKVQLVDSTDNIDIGNVDLMLDGGTAVLGGAGDVAAGVLRVTLANDDVHFGAVGGAADVDGTIHGQLRYIGDNQLANNHNVVVTSAPTTAVTGTFWQATQPVSIASNQAVDGSIVTLGAKADAKSIATDATSITMMQVLKQISASVQAIDSGQLAANHTVDLGSNNDVTISSGTVTANLGTTDTDHLSEIEGAVETIESAIYVDDADWDGSSKHMLVGGLYGSNTITSGDVGPIALAADGAVHIDDGGNTITVDGTITANAGSGTLAVSLASVPSHAVTNAGTFAVQESGDALTALQLIDNSIFVDNAGFTLTSSSVNVAGGVYQNGTPGTLGDNDAGAILLNSTSGQMVELMASTAAIGKVGHDITGIVSDRDVDVGTTAEKIHTASDVPIKRIDIQAAPANTGYIFVGDGGVAGDGTGGGIRLAAGDFYSLDIDNTGDVYVAASEANEDVYYTYYT